MATKAVDYITEGVGYVDIKLSRPAKLNGVDQEVVRMREPTVGDTEVISEMAGSDATREIHAIANLCDLAPADLRKLPQRDFNRLQRGYMTFID